MALADIVITDAAITPNPVQVEKQYIISVEIKPVEWVLGDNEGFLMDADGRFLAAPDGTINYLSTGIEGEYLADADGSFLEIPNE